MTSSRSFSHSELDHAKNRLLSFKSEGLGRAVSFVIYVHNVHKEFRGLLNILFVRIVTEVNEELLVFVRTFMYVQ